MTVIVIACMGNVCEVRGMERYAVTSNTTKGAPIVHEEGEGRLRSQHEPSV